MENRDKNRISWEVDRDKERKSVLRSYQERILDAKIALKEAARQGVRPSEDPKAIKIYTRLRQIETALHGLQRELNEKRGNRKNAATKKPVTASL